MKRDEVLDTAKELINGQRAQDYGDAYDNHSRIASGWNIIISGALKSHGHLTPSHVALMMDWVKSARLVENIDHQDSWVDKCGYSALGAEHNDKQDNPPSLLLPRHNEILNRLRAKNAK
jgi:hypothetical protein